LDEDFPVFANDQIRMFCLWNDRGRMPWHTPGYYGQEEGVLTPNEFSRLHKNEWVSSVDVFVEISWWNACQSEISLGPENEPWIVALDAGVSGDNFALVAVSRHSGNDTHSVVRYARKWAPPKGGKIDFQGTKEEPGPERELRRLIDEHNVIQIAYDPYQLEDMAGRLRKEGLGWFKAFSQAKDRLIADSQLRQMIMERRIHHSGEHDLKEHIGNANAKIDPEERKIRIVKRSELLKVDLAVALSMANGECMRLNL
jgi:phage terminase large subunit-like protein